MAFAMAFGNCYGCGRPFGYNPMRVPSIRIAGDRKPICLTCVNRANPMREANGLEPIVPHPEAYEPCDESELS
jgi:hypothetical protein